jgi:hypothetical protein
MDEWVGGLMDGCVEEWMVGSMGGLMDAWICEWFDGWVT